MDSRDYIETNDEQPEDLELFRIGVGEKFPLFTESLKKMKGQDGAFFEASEYGQGYMFCIHFTNIKDVELNIIRNRAITMRIVQEDNFVLPLIRFGGNMIFEMVFDPTLYKDARALQMVGKNNLLSIFLIESLTGVVKVIRQANFPLKMIQTCKEAWSRAILDVKYSEKYNAWYERLQARYTPDGLWNRGIYVGKMGESFDLGEINVPTIRRDLD